MFDAFRGKPVSVVGQMDRDGDLWGPLRPRCIRLGVDAVPHFMGSLLYFEPGAVCSKVFVDARGVQDQGETYGIRRYRGHISSDPSLSIAMAINGLEPIPDDGTIKADWHRYTTRRTLSVLRGVVRMENEPRHRRFQGDWPITVSKAPIVHFLGGLDSPQYRREAAALRWTTRGISPRTADFLAHLLVGVPRMLRDRAKDILRPAWHLLRRGQNRIAANFKAAPKAHDVQPPARSQH